MSQCEFPQYEIWQYQRWPSPDSCRQSDGRSLEEMNAELLAKRRVRKRLYRPQRTIHYLLSTFY